MHHQEKFSMHLQILIGSLFRWTSPVYCSEISYEWISLLFSYPKYIPTVRDVTVHSKSSDMHQVRGN
jgi:hypothetical protein